VESINSAGDGVLADIELSTDVLSPQLDEISRIAKTNVRINVCLNAFPLFAAQRFALPAGGWDVMKLF
jgi:hypothetical protein